MFECLIDNFDYFLSIFAIIVSFLAVFFTRRNIKTQIYIETITTQRIKWIEKLRRDLSDVVSGINILGFCDEQDELYNEVVVFEVGGEEQESAYEHHLKLNKLKDKLDTDEKQINLLNKIDLSILRLNQNDDCVLIAKLEELKENILHRQYKKCIKNDCILELKKLIADTLKKEWEKVKDETRRGREKKFAHKYLHMFSK